MKDIKKVMIKVMKPQAQKTIKDSEASKMAFCRKMRSPKRLTEPKEGSPYGDIRYGAFDKFSPSGGGEK